MKLLLCGTDSLQGRSLLDRLQQETFQVRTLTAAELLQLDTSGVTALLGKERPDLVINADQVPFDSTGLLLERHNADLPALLASVCVQLSVPLMQLSDSHVFSGDARAPYPESAEPDAQSAYGAMRWRGESAVIEHCERYCLLRVGDAIDSVGDNLLTQLVATWQRSGEVVVSDTLSLAPTPVSDVARVIIAILQQLRCGANTWGTYHYCSADIVTEREFAGMVLRIAEENEWVKAGAWQIRAADRQSTPVINRVLDCQRLRYHFGIRQRSWRPLLAPLLHAMLVPMEK